MPRPNDYPRWRFYSMQAAMWGVLACTIGVAALVNYDKQHSWRVELGEPTKLATVSVRLPSTWRVGEQADDGVSMIEPIRVPWQRMLAVSERDPSEMGVLERFMTLGQAQQRRPGVGKQTIDFGDLGKGTLINSRISLSPFGDEFDADARIEFRASCSTSSGHIITITLNSMDRDNEINPADIDLIKRIAASIKKLDATPPPSIRAR